MTSVLHGPEEFSSRKPTFTPKGPEKCYVEPNIALSNSFSLYFTVCGSILESLFKKKKKIKF